MHLNYKTENQILHMVDLEHDKKGKLYEVCDRFHSNELLLTHGVRKKKLCKSEIITITLNIQFMVEHFRCNKKN